MLQKAIITTVDYCTRFATQVIGIALLLAVVSGIYAARHFAIDADVNKLISFDLPWRQREVTFEKFFAPKKRRCWRSSMPRPPSSRRKPPGPSLRNCPARRISFHAFMEAGGGPFFQKNGLLFPPIQEVVGVTKKLGEAKPIIQALAQDPNLRGLTTALNYGLIGARMNHYTLDDLSGTLNMVSDTLDEVIAGRPRASPGARCSTAAPRMRASVGASSISGRCSTIPP